MTGKARLIGSVIGGLELVVTILTAVALGSLQWSRANLAASIPEKALETSSQVDVGLLRARATVVQQLGFGVNRESVEAAVDKVCSAFEGVLAIPGSSAGIALAQAAGSGAACERAAAAGKSAFAFVLTSLLLNFLAACGFAFWVAVGASYASYPARTLWAFQSVVVGAGAALLTVGTIAWGAGLHVAVLEMYPAPQSVAIGPHAALCIAALLLNLLAAVLCCALWGAATRGGEGVVPAEARPYVVKPQGDAPKAAQRSVP
eukprot:tig00001629_g9523.t1